jgi:transcriptional regulator with XRE-family HTH domain
VTLLHIALVRELPYNAGHAPNRSCGNAIRRKASRIEKRGWLTQVELATSGGVPLGTIREYEQSKRRPLLENAIKLASALGLSVQVFAECVTEEAKPAARKRPRRKREPK